MTKKDIHSLISASAYGLGGFLLFWFFLRPKTTVREIDPVTVKFEGSDS